jgi:hypothetical protein
MAESTNHCSEKYYHGQINMTEDDFLNDMREVINRYDPNDSNFDNWIEQFELLVEEKMKKWGTYEPLQQMRMMQADGTCRMMNVWINPNFSGQCLISGLELGFMLSFKHPIDGCEVEVDFKYATMSFIMVKKKRA